MNGESRKTRRPETRKIRGKTHYVVRIDLGYRKNSSVASPLAVFFLSRFVNLGEKFFWYGKHDFGSTHIHHLHMKCIYKRQYNVNTYRVSGLMDS